ncbi:MAG: acetyl-CoA decarbonylase/synthase complex subunit gamma [Candidatus Hydrothermarchaeales archaeon]
MARISPMDIYKLLPGENCKECGEATCMAFASALIERKKSVEDCPLFEEEKYKKKKGALIELLAPPVKEIVIGTGERAVTIGGEEVMYRHELTYFNETAIAVDVDDEMGEDEIIERVEDIDKFRFERVGEELTLDAIAIRSKTGDQTEFGDAVLTVVKNSNLPLILCSYDPELLEVGLEIALDRRPLVYAATKENWRDVAELSSKHDCPIVASCPEDIGGLMNLVRSLMDEGVGDIVLDIGTYLEGEKFDDMVENLAIIRRMGIDDGVKELGFPILCVPMVSWVGESDAIDGGFNEATLAVAQLLRYSDISIVHSLDMWAILPQLTIRQNIYTDPRKPVQVDSGLYTFGTVDENSPVLMTTNFALTYYTVAGDIESAGLSCYLLVTDTEGLAVEPAMAGGKLVSSIVKDVMDQTKIGEKVKHKKLIIPGMAARIKGDIEDETSWDVLVGPMDSSRIPDFLDKNWNYLQ